MRIAALPALGDHALLLVCMYSRWHGTQQPGPGGEPSFVHVLYRPNAHAGSGIHQHCLEAIRVPPKDSTAVGYSVTSLNLDTYFPHQQPRSMEAAVTAQ